MRLYPTLPLGSNVLEREKEQQYQIRIWNTIRTTAWYLLGENSSGARSALGPRSTGADIFQPIENCGT